MSDENDDVYTPPVKVDPKRPEAPAEMTPKQVRIWKTVVNSEPVDFFSTPATQNMLMDYCRHRETAESLTDIISQFDKNWLKSSIGSKRFKELLGMREKETRAAAAMARGLRLTNQSRYTPSSASTAEKNMSPAVNVWDFGKE